MILRMNHRSMLQGLWKILVTLILILNTSQVKGMNLVDLMSRMPGIECTDMCEVSGVGYLPKVILKGKECKGGGDSLFESVWYVFYDLIKDGL